MLSGKKYANGFTIVELLVVIIIIAILASVATVAYNGVQIRAKTRRFKQISQVSRNPSWFIRSWPAHIHSRMRR